MIREILMFLCVCSLPIVGLAQGHTSLSAKTPRMVVGIVIEDFNPDYIERYWDQFGTGGFQRLFTHGFICANHHYDNLLQRPAVNMATLFTGTTPSRHGIVNDFWIDRLKKKEIDAIQDNYYTTVGSDSNSGECSAVNLMTPTLGDQLKIITKGRSRVFSVALNAASAVMAAGHAADGAYWFDPVSGKMISSSYYVENFPKWAFDYNALKLPDFYFQQSWTPLKELSAYSASLSDMTLKESGYMGKYNTLPIDMGKLKRESGGNYKLLKSTPFGNTIVKDFSLQMIPKEQIGYDFVPDLLTVVFSSMDSERYAFGPFSIEMEDTYLRLDQEIATLLKYIEDGYGTDDVLFYLTGSTSISYPAEYLKEKYRMTSGIFNPESAVALLKSYMNIKYGSGDYVQLFTNQQIYLNHDLIEKKKLDLKEVQNSVALFLNQFEGIAYAKGALELEANNFPGGLLEPFQNNYHIKRSGDILIKYVDGWQPKDKFNPVDYTDNNQVPLVWYGAGIKRGTTLRRTNATDIVPTIAAFLGISPAGSVSGNVIQELFLKRE